MNLYSIVGILAIVLVLYYILVLTIELRNIYLQLIQIRKETTNIELVLKSRNPMIIKIVDEINLIIRNQKQSYLSTKVSIHQFDTAINNIAHDLRTPLTVASGYTQYLIENHANEDENIALLPKVYDNLKNVENKLEDLLEYNRLNEDENIINLEKINLSRLLEEKILNMYEAFESNKFDMNLNIKSNIECICDKKMVERIIQNVLEIY